MKDKIYAVWFANAVGINSKYTEIFCNMYSSFEEIYNLQYDEIVKIQGITKKTAQKLLDKNTDASEDILKNCIKNGIDITTFYDVKYPTVLKNIPTPPAVLYVKGQLPDFESTVSIAVVGSRKCSVYGTVMSEQISEDLGRNGITIISGMARGIDSAAHKGALKSGAKTIAVLGCGADIAYPAENAGLKSMIEQNGAVISEFPPGTPPLPGNFPVRNRIISGLAEAVTVIEGKASSGSTITANLAKDYGKEVFCLPGNVDNPLSSASHKLIREGARLITCTADIIEDMALYESGRIADIIYSEEAIANKYETAFAKLTGEQRAIARVLSNVKPVTIDEICYKTGMEIALVNQCLFMLEIDKIVKQMPGKQYILCL